MSKRAEVDPDKRGVEHQPSETAMGAAFLRAMAATDGRTGIRGPDDLAERFLAADHKVALQDGAIREWVLRNRVSPGMYEFMIARTAFFDDMVRGALHRNIPQIVFLGAGYDSRSYRFREHIREARLFELDMPPTQRRKRELLDRAGIAIPDRLAFVPIDFRTDSIGDTLNRAGFERTRETLFVWEGVTYYLPRDVVGKTLTAVRTASSAGSSICFDYAARSPVMMSDPRVKKLRETMQSHYPGEPTSFSLPVGEIEPFLLSKGYRMLEHLDSEEMEKQYLTLPDGSSAGKVPAIFCFVHAAVTNAPCVS
jgi:methyltransferase (TIGR00027 family)